MLQALLCLGVGSATGVALGALLFGGEPARDFSFLSDARDKDPDDAGPYLDDQIQKNLREMLPFTGPWTVWPDYQRWVMINRILRIMWPQIKQVARQTAIPIIAHNIQAALGKVAVVEDICLGEHSMLQAEGIQQLLQGKQLTFGDHPPRVSGCKVYTTDEDECIMELPLMWGSTVTIDATAVVRLGPLRLVVPLSVANLTVKGTVRLTLSPLVEQLPCIGGITFCLLETPHVDMDLRLFYGVDLMALPGIKEAVNNVVKGVLGGLMVYPSHMSVPLMANFGVPPPAKGMLEVQLVKVANLQGGSFLDTVDPYVSLEVREGRRQKSRTMRNNPNPEFKERFSFIVDDFNAQSLKIKVYHDNFGFRDAIIGEAKIPFEDENVTARNEFGDLEIVAKKKADFIAQPMTEKTVNVQLDAPSLESLKEAGMLSSITSSLASSTVGTKIRSSFFSSGKVEQAERPKPVMGTMTLKLKYLPFLQSAGQVEYGEDGQPKPVPSAHPSKRKVGRVDDNTKGVLTVKLMRCNRLALEDKQVDAYVQLILKDSDPRKTEDEVQWSRTVFNDSDPRFDEKFDFPMISAGSVLHVVVMDKTTASEVMGWGKALLTGSKADRKMGSLRLQVRDVARNGRIRDCWPLADSEQGTVELLLEWQTCYLQLDDDE